LENLEKLKQCAACGEWLAESRFHRNSATRDGRHAYCRLCRKRKRLARILAGGKQPRRRAQGVPVYVIANGAWRLIEVLLPGAGK
jgi:hypothetical protein